MNDLINDENSNHDNDNNRINKLDIPNGLKEMLIDHQFTIERLHDISAEDLSMILGIDDSIARIIINATRKLHEGN